MAVERESEPTSEGAASGLRSKLEFSVWRKSFDRAHTAWSNAPAELKPALLLSGQDLARAESWLVDFADKLSESERHFIIKSKTRRHHPQRRGQTAVPRKSTLYYVKLYSGPMLSVLVIAFLVVGRLFAPQIVEDMVAQSNAEYAASKTVRSEGRTGEAAGSGGSGEPLRSGVAGSPATGTGAIEPLAQAERASEPRTPASLLRVPTGGRSRAAEKVARLEDMASHSLEAGDKDAALRFAVEALGSALDSGDSTIRADTARALLYRTMARKAGDGMRPLEQSGEPATRLCPGGQQLLILHDGNGLWRWPMGSPAPTGGISGRRVVFEGAAVDQSCEFIALVGDEHGAEILSLASGQRLAAVLGHEAPVLMTAFTPDGRTLVTASEDKTARLWNAADGRVRAVLDAHEAAVIAVAVSPDGRLLVSASADNTARVWDVTSGRERHLLAGHSAAVTSAAFLPGTAIVLTTSRDGTAALWDAETGKRLRVLMAPGGSIVFAETDPLGRVVATASDTGDVRLWQVSGDKAVDLAAGGGEPVRGVAFSPDGGMLLTLNWDGSAMLWNAGTGEAVARLGGPGQRLVTASFRPDGAALSALLADGALVTWPVVRSSRELLQEGLAAAPACLGRDERGKIGLGAAPPSWCRPVAHSAGEPAPSSENPGGRFTPGPSRTD